MKNLYLLLLFPAFIATAQHHAWQPEYAGSVNVLAPALNQRWLVAGVSGDPNLLFGRGYSAEAGPDGIVRERFFNLLERTELRAAVALPDGRLLVAGSADGCDFGFSGFIRLLDADGVEVWTVIRDWQVLEPYVPHFAGMVVTAQQEVIVVGESFIQKYDLETGLLLTEYQTGEGYFTGIAALPGTNEYVVCGSDGVFKLNYDDLSVSDIYPDISPSTYFNKIVADDTGLFTALRNDGRLYQGFYLPDGSVVNTLKDPGFKVHDLVPHNKGLALCGRHQDKTRVDLLDSTLATYKSLTLPNPDFYAQRIGVTDSEIVLAGLELQGPGPRSWFDNATNASGSRNFWLQRYTFDGLPLENGTDAALSTMLTHTQPKATQAGGGAPFPLWTVSGGTFSVRLENTGSEMLNEVHILAGNYGYEIPFICPAASYVNFKFEGLNLSPGAGTTLYLGQVGTPYTQVVSPWKLCFWVTTPNGKTDLNHDNDFVCQSFTLINSGDEAQAAEIALFPNPARDALFLKTGDSSPGLCRIFNVAGQLVGEQAPATENGAARLDLNRLTPGYYLLQTEIGWGRFVKE